MDPTPEDSDADSSDPFPIRRPLAPAATRRSPRPSRRRAAREQAGS